MELIVGMCYNKPILVHEGITHGNWPYPSTPAVAGMPAIMFRVVSWTDFGVNTYAQPRAICFNHYLASIPSINSVPALVGC